MLSRSLLSACMAMGVCLVASAQTPSPVQSTVRPLGLQPVAPVMLRATDARSQQFMADAIGPMNQFINNLLVSGKEFVNAQGYQLDSTRLFITSRQPYPVRVYFITEGAGYHNTVGFSRSLAGSTNMDEPRLVFPDASVPYASGGGNNIGNTNYGDRKTNEPLLPGDFVDLGMFHAGTQLDLFIVRDGARGGQDVFTAHVDLNVDRFQHVWASVIPDSPYLLVGFEDLLNGGDKDYEDVVLVIDIGEENINNLGLPN